MSIKTGKRREQFLSYRLGVVQLLDACRESTTQVLPEQRLIHHSLLHTQTIFTRAPPSITHSIQDLPFE